jgi:taurine dioxygenase
MRLVPNARATIGAEIMDIDLAREQPQSVIDAVLDALFSHHVLVFRDQSLTPRQQIAFSRRLGIAGPPERSAGLTTDHRDYPEIQWSSFLRADGSAPSDIRPSQADVWHTDYAYLPEPPELAFLYGVEIPQDGPDTLYIDMRATYDALPAAERRRLEGLHATHRQKGGLDPAIYRLPPYLREGEPDDGSAERSARHPLVRAHPVTGSKALYLAQCYTIGIDGLTPEEARDLTAGIYRQAVTPEFSYRHVWRAGDCVVWDNTATNHRRSKPMDRPRVLHRVTIALKQRGR